MSNLMYKVETNRNNMVFLYREDALNYYKDNNGTKLYSMTKDLFPEINVIIDGAGFDPYNLNEENEMNKTSRAERKAIKKYDDAKTIQLKCKLNMQTDKDIIDYLANCENKQGLIKELIRKEMHRQEQ